MRFHCLGVGSIGSLLATNLAHLPATQVRLILRRKDLAAQLVNPSSTAPAIDSDGCPTGTLTVERSGLARRTSNLEMELTRSPQDAWEQSNALASKRAPARIDPRVWNRQDFIHTLVITTKAPQTIPALKHLLGRITSRSVIVLCQNGMGVLESLLEKYWPEDRSDALEAEGEAARSRWGHLGGRPSFVCATTTHGAWRKGGGHFVHAGLGDLKFGVLPNRAVLSSLAQYPDPPWGEHADNPLLNPRSLVQPTLEHLPYSPITANLHTTLASLLACNDLNPAWLPLPSLQIAQLQKLAVNASVNSLTALMGVNNGALVGSQKAKRLIESVCRECSDVFAAHLAREEGTWAPPPAYDASDSEDDSFPARSTTPHPPPPPLPPSHPLSSHSLLDYTQRVLFKTAPNLSSTLSDLLSLHTGAPHAFSLTQNAPSLPSRTEIEYINGYVGALGRRYAVPTPTVQALGELVLLKEEMARVGAVDRVWEGRRGRDAGGGRSAERGARSQSPVREGGERGGSPTRRQGRSIFSSSSPPRGGGGGKSPYARGAEQLAQTRERREERARTKSRERDEDMQGG
ncbi:2-dehydropantoate 2-reductase (Ketopantoate reductase) (KPA reductase) (KPR) [Rhodotorula kratochvilovae]